MWNQATTVTAASRRSRGTRIRGRLPTSSKVSLGAKIASLKFFQTDRSAVAVVEG
jgi:hypothetical protein